MVHVLSSTDPPFKVIKLCGHFDHDDVPTITTSLNNWLLEKGCDVITQTEEHNEEVESTITIVSGQIERQHVRDFVKQLHAQPSITFE